MFQTSTRPRGEIYSVHKQQKWWLYDQKGALCFADTPVYVPHSAWAHAIAAEWPKEPPTNVLAIKGDRPATQVAKLAVLGTSQQPEKYIDNLLHYLTTDTVFYWQKSPPSLWSRQSQHWQPILDWSTQTFGLMPEVRTNLQPVAYSTAVTAAIKRYLLGSDAFQLAVLVFLCGLNGSLLLSLAQSARALSAEEAYQAAFLEAIYQRERWGADAEGDARLERAQKSFLLANTLLFAVEEGRAIS